MLSWGRSLDKPTWISSHRETFEVSLRSPWGGWSSQCVFNQKGSSGGHTNTRCWWRCSIHLTRCESDSAPHSHCPAALHHPPHTLTLGHLFLHTFPPRSRLFLWSVLLCECVYMREWAACLCVCWSSVCVKHAPHRVSPTQGPDRNMDHPTTCTLQMHFIFIRLCPGAGLESFR